MQDRAIDFERNVDREILWSPCFNLGHNFFPTSSSIKSDIVRSKPHPTLTGVIIKVALCTTRKSGTKSSVDIVIATDGTFIMSHPYYRSMCKFRLIRDPVIVSSGTSPCIQVGIEVNHGDLTIKFVQSSQMEWSPPIIPVKAKSVPHLSSRLVLLRTCWS